MLWRAGTWPAWTGFARRSANFFLPPCKAEDFSGKGKEKIGKAEEKIGRAEDFFSLFFLPPGKEKDFSGKAEEFSDRGKEISGHEIASSPQRAKPPHRAGFSAGFLRERGGNES